MNIVKIAVGDSAGRQAAIAARRVLRVLGVLGVLGVVGAAHLFAAAAIAKQAKVEEAVCPPGPSFTGRAASTPSRGLKRFMMVSAYRLEPYSPAYLDNVLADLGRQQINGIVYTALGEISSFLRNKKGLALDELQLNRDIYERARANNANLWLQMRVYANELQPEGESPPRNLTAEEILTSPAADQAFRQRVREEFGLYNKYFSSACTVIMFEEAGIYHAPQGGGRFWSSEPAQVGKPNDHYDRMFAERMAGIFSKAREEIKRINPGCQVGMHLGHSVFNNEAVLKEAIDGLRGQGAKPDFIFYDFYLKAQPDFDSYAAKLTRRANFITKTLKLPAYHLAQLHTMNAFQHGLGKTLSREEIDRVTDLSLRAGFSGIGFYSKNATRTSDDSPDAFDPNERGQGTVYETSKDRWDYGLLKLREIGGVDLRNRFDLVVRANSEGRLLARNVKSNKFEPLGDITPSRKRGGDSVMVFRDLDAGRYLKGGRALELKIEDGGPLEPDAFLVTPSEPTKEFRESSALANETAMQHSRGATKAEASPSTNIDGGTMVCVP